MKGISVYFMTMAVLAVTIGMAWGIFMAITQDHLMAPAHAHLNLVGWVTMSIFAFYYHLVPAAQEGVLPKIHFALAALGLVVMIPGIAIAITKEVEALAAIGSILTFCSMLLFLIVVLKTIRTQG